MTPLRERINPSAMRSAVERLLAPTGSMRWTTFSVPTLAAIGICERSRSGKLSRMERPRVTTPETPNPGSSARS
jgi:hypothetical protein